MAQKLYILVSNNCPFEVYPPYASGLLFSVAAAPP
jgi:hypothetical protein